LCLFKLNSRELLCCTLAAAAATFVPCNLASQRRQFLIRLGAWHISTPECYLRSNVADVHSSSHKSCLQLQLQLQITISTSTATACMSLQDACWSFTTEEQSTLQLSYNRTSRSPCSLATRCAASLPDCLAAIADQLPWRCVPGSSP
jgi:hypothetical protein